MAEFNTEYYNNGDIKSQVFIINGKKEGEYKKYYKNGILGSCYNYTNDIKNGECKHYHIDGKIWLVYNYINGKIEGQCKEYHENGQLKDKPSFFYILSSIFCFIINLLLYHQCKMFLLFFLHFHYKLYKYHSFSH